MIGTPKIENLDRYCDYHGEKGHYTNDYYQLKRQLEAVLELEKLNHLVKDVRQRGNNWGRQAGNNSTNGKVINMVYVRAEGKKCKCQREREEDWINVPITFPPIQSDDVSDEPLIIKAEVEARWTQTHMELVGFSGEQLLLMGVISIQYHIRADRNEGTLSRSIHNECNDEVPNLKRNCCVGSSDSGNFRMPTVGRKADLTRRSAERKDGEKG
ncbi:hypothetical protein Tco_1387387 [Tanacetum coccineum]